jgi:hypothetical protein
MRSLFFVVWLAGCASMHSSKDSFSGAEAAVTESSKMTKVERGPVRVTRTEEDYGPSQETPAEASKGGLPDVQAGKGRAGQERQEDHRNADAGAPRASEGADSGRVLLRRVITVTERAPVTSTTEAISDTHQESLLSAKDESTSKFKFGLTLWPYLLGAALLGALGFLAWKLKPPWLGWLFKLLGR